MALPIVITPGGLVQRWAKTPTNLLFLSEHNFTCNFKLRNYDKTRAGKPDLCAQANEQEVKRVTIIPASAHFSLTRNVLFNRLYPEHDAPYITIIDNDMFKIRQTPPLPAILTQVSASRYPRVLSEPKTKLALRLYLLEVAIVFVYGQLLLPVLRIAATVSPRRRDHAIVGIMRAEHRDLATKCTAWRGRLSGRLVHNEREHKVGWCAPLQRN